MVAITDHHDMTFVPYAVKAAEAGPPVLVMPGVEVTCNDNTQCLVLFDPSCPVTTWTHFLGKLKGVQQASVDDPKTAVTVNAGSLVNMAAVTAVSGAVLLTLLAARH
jgi:hypothetical protein